MPLTVVNVAYPFAPVSRGTAGGAEQVIAAIDDALVEAGHRSIVVACEGSEVRGELVAMPCVSGVLDEAACAAARARHREVLAALRADVVHFHGVDFDAYAGGGRAVVTMHLPPSWYSPAALAREGTTYVCVSESERRAFRGEAVVIGNGVEIGGGTPPGQPAGTPAFLCLGRVCEEKGFHDAVDAAKLADAELVIAGECFAYPQHRRYFEHVLKPRLDARRTFIGPAGAQRKRQLLASARAVLIPSTVAETSSLVAMEALACGTPVIAYRSGALPEIVDDGVTGYLVNGVRGLVSAMEQVGAIDRAACRRAAEERFDVRQMTAKYLALYAGTIPPCAGS